MKKDFENMALVWEEAQSTDKNGISMWYDTSTCMPDESRSTH